jgi:hypothetical protein
VLGGLPVVGLVLTALAGRTGRGAHLFASVGLVGMVALLAPMAALAATATLILGWAMGREPAPG